jgi:RNA polymerase sigma factor (sigma-70 family)
MPNKALNGVFHRIRALAAVQTSRGSGDRELLARFLAADEAAFTLLVERHGPMVLGLCRRLLRDRHEADDACQATFLVLARKARSVRKQESLASWLHGVAYRVCISLRRQQARRRRREQAVRKPAVHETDRDLSWREFHAVLDQELQRLPQRYRDPLILCYLEGKTRDEAAQHLGAKAGALHGLLDRGRKLLRDRLTRRGLTLSGVLFASALSETATAALAPGLVVTSVRAASALAAGGSVPGGLIAPHVLSLVQEASKTMLMTKLKIGAALVVAAGIVTGLAGGTLSSVSFAQDKAAAGAKAPAAPQKTESDEDFIRRTSKELRGIEPSATEVHFFVSSKDANRRQRLLDLFIQDRQAKERAQASPTNQPLALEATLDIGSDRGVMMPTTIVRNMPLRPSRFKASSSRTSIRRRRTRRRLRPSRKGISISSRST